jgi:RNA polymerase sigma-70 factor (ECF subfamily)
MSGDVEFVKLVDRYYGSLYRFAFSLTRTEADACDLVQETYYIWTKKRGQIRDATRIKSWLFTTLHREFLQACRRRTRHPTVELDEVEGDLAVAPETNWNRIDARQIAVNIDQLDECFRAPLALFYVEDFSYQEIAGALDLPMGTVKSRLSRGIAMLRVRLSSDIQTGKGTNDE